MKISIGSDHGGFLLKEEIKKYLLNKGFEVVDVGTYSIESCHYPEFTIKSAELVSKGECQFGIGVCTTGEGVVMTANKIKGIRAGIAYNKDVARLMREHNDANFIVFGAKYTSLEEDMMITLRLEGMKYRRIGQWLGLSELAVKTKCNRLKKEGKL